MGTLNSAVLFELVLAGPSTTVAETLACDAGRVATIQEPSISKLLPAVGCGADSGHRLDRSRDRRLQYAVLGGSTVGLTAAVLKNVSVLFPLAGARGRRCAC